MIYYKKRKLPGTGKDSINVYNVATLQCPTQILWNSFDHFCAFLPALVAFTSNGLLHRALL